MYILTIPSFTWIKVDQSSQSAPSARAGHTCTMQDGQIVIVGGFSGLNAPCDSPGMYIFDASTLQWTSSFTAGDHPSDYHPDNSVLAGSFGYTVPKAVQSVIGGNSEGSATATTPAVGRASSGPFATGKPPVFTITQGVATATVTSPSQTQTQSSSSSGDSQHSSSSRSSLIIAGVIAGIAGMLALYLGFCAYLYRRQIKAYKHHLAVANHYANSDDPSAALSPDAPFVAAAAGTRGSWRRSKNHSRDSNSTDHGLTDATRWLGEPKWMSSSGESTTPVSGGSGGSAGRREDEGRRLEARGSWGSAEGLLDGQEPSFFSVVMGPRRALRVVNGAE